MIKMGITRYKCEIMTHKNYMLKVGSKLIIYRSVVGARFGHGSGTWQGWANGQGWGVVRVSKVGARLWHWACLG